MLWPGVANQRLAGASEPFHLTHVRDVALRSVSRILTVDTVGSGVRAERNVAFQYFLHDNSRTQVQLLCVCVCARIRV